MSGGLVVVGAGLAGAELVRNLRREGFGEAIRMFGREPFPPYDRPPLSKAFLQGSSTTDGLLFRSRDAYAEIGVELHTDATVSSVDAGNKTIRLESGETFGYDACVFATGAQARVPDVGGIALEGVHVLRTIEDAIRLRGALKPGVRMAVAGGGFLGLEVAASARAAGAGVTVIEAAESLLQRSISPLTAAAIEERHRRAGVRILLNTTLRSIDGESRVEAVTTSHGDVIEADLVLVAIGAQPAIELALRSGLDCDNGIRVDARCRTSVADIYAIGDCASQFHAKSGRHHRLEAVSAAVYQARCVAADLVGKPPPPSRPLTFWSEQHDFMLQTMGLPAPGIPCEDVLRGDAAAGFAVYRFQEGELVAVEAVNRPKDLARARGMIGQVNVTLPAE